MNSVVERLRTLIGIPSVSSLSNGPVVDYASGIFQQAGWALQRLPYTDSNGVQKHNLLAFAPGQDKSRGNVDLGFVCHTDTVPYSADWHDAITARVEDGFVHGCGACDVKGFLACLLSL
jgi:acetylornithine deacetylase